MLSTHPDLLQSDPSTENDRASPGGMDCGSSDLEMNTDVSLQDGCWISPPEHSYTSSSGCTTGLTQISSYDNLEKIDALIDDGVEIEGPGATDQETKDSSNNQEVETDLVEGRIESADNSAAAFKQVRGQECDNSDPKSYGDSTTRVTRGKTKIKGLILFGFTELFCLTETTPLLFCV